MSIVPVIRKYTHILRSASSNNSYLNITRHNTVPLDDCENVSRGYPTEVRPCYTAGVM